MERAKSKLQDLLSLWHEKRGSRPCPSRGDLPVTTLRPWLGHVALIDIAGPAPYFRLCGTALHARFGGEMTGQQLDAVDERYGGATLVKAVEKARATLRPTQLNCKVARDHGGAYTFHELCVPLGNDGEHANMVLFASYAEQPR